MTTNLTTRHALEIPPKMVLEIASGMEDPAAIAERYGFDESEWSLLRNHAPFIKQVDEKKQELSASGYTFRMKAAVAAEAILEEVSKKALLPEASFHTQLEALKFTSRAAGLDAPPKEIQETSPGFSITINLGNGNSVEINAPQKGNVIESEVEEEVPSYLRVIDPLTMEE